MTYSRDATGPFYHGTRGREVLHLMGPHKAEPARLSPGAAPAGETLTYPAG